MMKLLVICEKRRFSIECKIGKDRKEFWDIVLTQCQEEADEDKCSLPLIKALSFGEWNV